MSGPIQVNRILETQDASKYYAMYVIQNNISKQAFIPGSDIGDKILSYVKKHDSKKLYEQLENEIRENVISVELTRLINGTVENIKTWEDVLRTYVLLYNVAIFRSRYGSNVEYVEKCIDTCAHRNITNWIILHGGWNEYFENNNLEINKVTRYNYMKFLGVCSAILSVVGVVGAAYLYRAKNIKKTS
jgi:hypothetical protein